ncbi:MAG: hypothetical protein ACRDNT_03275 [Streptosporangiaceae bacterium]
MLTMAAAAWWPFVLTRRMDAAARPARAGASRQGGRPALPRTPAGAVTAKEIRMWVRDPVRLTCLLIAVIVGAAACAIPRVTAGTNLLLPYAEELRELFEAESPRWMPIRCQRSWPCPAVPPATYRHCL